jgi:hypothetical protein
MIFRDYSVLTLISLLRDRRTTNAASSGFRALPGTSRRGAYACELRGEGPTWLARNETNVTQFSGITGKIPGVRAP